MYDINGVQVNKPSDDDDPVFNLKTVPDNSRINPRPLIDGLKVGIQQAGNGFQRGVTLPPRSTQPALQNFHRNITTDDNEAEEPEGDFINLNFAEDEETPEGYTGDSEAQ